MERIFGRVIEKERRRILKKFGRKEAILEQDKTCLNEEKMKYETKYKEF
jgi:hypothetical protein